MLSTPARCHSQDGINAHVRGSGITCIRPSTGPGAGSPNFRTSSRHARYASSAVTFCSRTDGISDSSTSPVRVSRSPGRRCRVTATSRWRGSKASGSSAEPSISGN
uniref:Uncharacterized protein n=1 Tax=Streptomyces avermitilis TaxID=33903 RepID=A0A499VFA7_STRAX|nr:hypothetical protein SAVMC3_57620 [Streptomyces avermitilis]